MKYIQKEFDINTIIKVSDEFIHQYNVEESMYIALVMDLDFLIWPLMSSGGTDSIPALPQHIFNVDPKCLLLMVLEDNDHQYLVDLPEHIGKEIEEWKKIAATNQYHAKAILLETAAEFEKEYGYFTHAYVKHEMVKEQLNAHWFISDIGNKEAYLHKKLPVSNTFYYYYEQIRKNKEELYELLNIKLQKSTLPPM